MTKVLFICHGNICRSPMAEFVLKSMTGDNFHIESAATSREEIGNDIYPPAKKKLTEKGVPFEKRGARQMTAGDYSRYDFLIGMDDANIRNMKKICGGDPEGKIFKLTDFSQPDKSIADPWYTGDFEETFLDVFYGCKGFIDYLNGIERFSLTNPAGRRIPLRASLKGDMRHVVVMAHGFGGSKESPTVTMLLEALPQLNIGVIGFDFPGHGERAEDELTVSGCIADLETVTDFAKSRVPGAEIVNFGTSYGAYITMLLIAKNGGKTPFKGIFRSAAVNMPELFVNLPEENREQLARTGQAQLAYEPHVIRITESFLRELWENNLFEKFEKNGAELLMIHGTDDALVDFAKAEEFAEKFDVRLEKIEGGDHQLSLKGIPKKVTEITKKFITEG